MFGAAGDLNWVQMTNAIELVSIWEEARSRRACFVPNPGNAGDALIALGTFHALEAAGLADLPTIPLARLGEIEAFDMVLFGGGGSLIPMYGMMLEAIQTAYRLGKDIVVLPQSTTGYGEPLRLMSDRIRFFCREFYSYNGLLGDGFPPARATLAPDMAFSIRPGFFSKQAALPRSGTGFCFRTDGETARGAPPAGNRDISLWMNGDLWDRRRFTASVCRTLAEYLAEFETIETDRLHLGVLSAILGRTVNLYDNMYYKNRAVYEYSLREHYSNVEFHRIHAW